MKQRILSFICLLSILCFLFLGQFSAHAEVVVPLMHDGCVYWDNNWSGFPSTWEYPSWQGKDAIQFYQRPSNKANPRYELIVGVDSGYNLYFHKGKSYQVVLGVATARGWPEYPAMYWNASLQGSMKVTLRLQSRHDVLKLLKVRPKGYKENRYDSCNFTGWKMYTFEFISDDDYDIYDIEVRFSSDYVQANPARFSITKNVIYRELAPVIAEESKGFFSGLINSIGNFFSQWFSWISNNLSGPINAVQIAVDNVKSAVTGIANSVWNKFSGPLESISASIGGIATSVWNKFSGTLSNIRDGIGGIATSVWDKFSGTLSNIRDGIGGIANSVWNKFSSTLSNIRDGIGGIATSVWNKFSSTLINIRDGIGGVASGIWDRFREPLANIGQSVWNFFRDPLGGIKDAISNLGSSIGNTIKSVFVPSGEWLSNYVQSQADWLSDRLGALYYPVDLVVDLYNRFQNLTVPEPVLKFPSIKINVGGKQYKLTDEVNYNMKNELEEIPAIKQLHNLYLSMVDVILVFCILKLAYAKLNAILGGVNK